MKPKPDNAIFECRVLSRTHAQIWYQDGNFFLKDTGSSNGSFVNGKKLNDNEKQVKSGDVLQFGVDVDNNPRQTYSCVVSQIRCVQPDGSESDWTDNNSIPIDNYTKANSSSVNSQAQNGHVRRNTETRTKEHEDHHEDRNQIEKMKGDLMDFGTLTENIETKMVTIQRVIEEIGTMQQEQWNEKLNEDILLTKVENLERKLQVDDLSEPTVAYQSLCDEMTELQETSKKALRQSLQEKLIVQQQNDELKVELNASEEENEKNARDIKKFQDLIALCSTKEEKFLDDLTKKDEALNTNQVELETIKGVLEQQSAPDFKRSIRQITTLSELSSLTDGDRQQLKDLTDDVCKIENHDTTAEFMLAEELQVKEELLQDIAKKDEEISRLSELTENSFTEIESFKLQVETVNSEKERAEAELTLLKEEHAEKIEEFKFKQDEMDVLQEERIEKADRITKLTNERDSIYNDLLNQSTHDHHALVAKNENFLKIIYVLCAILVLLLALYIKNV